MQGRRLKLLLGMFIAVLPGLFFALDPGQYLTFTEIEARLAVVRDFSRGHFLLTLGCYFVCVFLLSALSLPGIVILIMAAGAALFDFWITLLAASFADSLGSTAAFLLSRYLLGNSLQARFPEQLAMLNRGIARDGAFYLFSLRLMPFFPCFLINLLMGLTRLRTLTFYWVTQVSKLPYKAIFAYTGAELGRLEAPGELFSLRMILGFVFIGLFPLGSRWSLQWYRARRHAALPVCSEPQAQHGAPEQSEAGSAEDVERKMHAQGDAPQTDQQGRQQQSRQKNRRKFAGQRQQPGQIPGAQGVTARMGGVLRDARLEDLQFGHQLKRAQAAQVQFENPLATGEQGIDEERGKCQGRLEKRQDHQQNEQCQGGPAQVPAPAEERAAAGESGMELQENPPVGGGDRRKPVQQACGTAQQAAHQEQA